MSQVALEETTSQLSAIRHLLKSGGSITPIQALKWYGCFRLGARIHNLRAEGMDIETERVTEGRKTFARYSLKPNSK